MCLQKDFGIAGPCRTMAKAHSQGVDLGRTLGSFMPLRWATDAWTSVCHAWLPVTGGGTSQNVLTVTGFEVQARSHPP